MTCPASPALHCTALHCTALHFTLLYTALHTVLHTVLHCTALHCSNLLYTAGNQLSLQFNVQYYRILQGEAIP